MAPTPAIADGRTHLVYEWITNLGNRSSRALAGLTILADSGPGTLLAWSADSLKAAVRPVGTPEPDPPAELLKSGRQRRV